MASISASEIAKLSSGKSQRSRSVSESHMDGHSVELCLADYAISEAVSESLPLYPGPYRWDHERRSILRCELDAAFFHLYGIDCADVDYIIEIFPIVKRKDEQQYGEYRTKLQILDIYDRMQHAIDTGKPYETLLDPPPGPPADEHGNFIPLSEWKPGHPKPPNCPTHIHPPKEVSLAAE